MNLAGRELARVLQSVMLTAALMVGADADDATAEVTRAVMKLQEAYDKLDLAYIKKNTVKDHMAIGMGYVFFNQAEQLKDLPNLKIKSYKVSGLKVVPLNKETALATFEAAIEGTYKGKKIDGRIRVVEVWVKRDGQWLEASYQETPLP